MKKQASTLLPALLDLLRQYLALDMAVYAGHATLLLLTASLPLLMWVLVIINMLPFYAVLSLALSLLTVTLIYTYVPGGKRRIRDQLPGAAAVVAVWTLFSKIFSFYIGHFWKLSYIYGSLAAIVLITLWLNVNINVLFLGARLNAKIQGMGQEKKEPDA